MIQKIVDYIYNGISVLDPWVCLWLFISYVAIDYFCVKHIIYSQKRETALKAAWTSVVISALGALSTLEFVFKPFYILPILIGVWVGTYIPVKSLPKKDAKGK